MSKLGDTILSAIDDGARNHAAIVDATGFDARQVSNQLFILKQSGAVVKGPDGYMRSDGTVGPKPTVHESAPAESSPPPAGRKKTRKAKPRVTKPRKAAKRVKARTAKRVAKTPRAKPIPVVADRIAFQRFGDYVVLWHRDLVDLVATLERWRSVVGND